MKQTIGFLSLLAAVWLLVPRTADSQVVEAWVARYDGPGSGIDAPTSIAIDPAGDVYVTGSTRTGGFATEDYTTIKYSPSGDTLWIRRLNGTGGGTDHANAIGLDMSGNIYITGQSWGLTTSYDYLTVKYSSDGDTLWTRRYNGPRNGGDIAHALTVDDDGNVYVTGESEGLVGTHGIFEDYATVKYTADGALDWVARYNGPAGDYDRANAIAVDLSGNACVTGTSDGGSSGSGSPRFDYATIKYDSLGMLQWVKRHNGDNGDDEATDITLDDLGNVYVTGAAHYASTDMDFVTLKYAADGDSLWFAWYNGPADNADEAAALEVDGSGNVYVTGRSYGGPGTDFDYTTICYNTLGDTTWVRRYDGPGGYDEATCLALDLDRNAYVSGYSNGGVTGSDYATIMYNSAGDQEWVITYSNSGSAGSEDTPSAIAVDSSHNVYVTGMSALDYATVKYAPTSTGVAPGPGDLPSGIRLFQNYPNPFNPSTTISYLVTVVSHVELAVFDLLGRRIASLVDERQSAGTHEIIWNAAGQASGTYFYRLKVGNLIETKRLVLLR